MRFERSAGILLHPTSLPGPFGIGDLGSEAYSFLSLKEISVYPKSDPYKIDYGEVIHYKKLILKKAYLNFKKNSNGQEENYNSFCNENEEWLNDFAFFMAAKDFHGGELWTKWGKGLVVRDKKSLDEWK